MLQKITQRNTQRLRLLSTTRRNRDTEPLHYLVCKPTDSVGIHLFGILREINAYHPHCLRHRMKQLVDEETEVLRTLWFPWHPHKEHPVLLVYNGTSFVRQPYRINCVSCCFFVHIFAKLFAQGLLTAEMHHQVPVKIGDADYLVLVTFHTLKEIF